MTTQTVYFPTPGRAGIREESISDPRPEEIQVRCLANGICMFEVSIFNGIEPRYLLGDRAGHEGVGIVTKVGKALRIFAKAIMSPVAAGQRFRTRAQGSQNYLPRHPIRPLFSLNLCLAW